MSEPVRMWTIYDHPRDFPNVYVARMFEADAKGSRATEQCLTSESLDLLRSEMVARGLTALSRSPEDDPKIIEVWL